MTQSGSYTVSVVGTCDTFSSETIEVVVNDAPDAPLAEGDVIPAPGTAQLTAVGDNLRWYDVPMDGEILGTGPSFETPFIEETTSFYVEDANLSGGEIAYGGKEDNSGNGDIQNNSTYFSLFDTYEDMIIKSVYVYADGSGERTIRVTTPDNGEIIAEGDFFIADGGSRIDIDFEIPAGSGYEFKTTGNPQLFRNSTGSGLQYPYALSDMGAITGTNIEGSNEFNYYYFFYDWEVQRPVSGCVSERVEVLAAIDTATSVADRDAEKGISIFPVPASDWLNIEFDFDGSYVLNLFDVSGKIHINKEGIANRGSVDQIAVGDLAPGLYLIRIVTDGKTLTKKVVVK